MRDPSLHPYMAFCGEPEYGAALVFARTVGEAKRLSFDTLKGWFDCTWVDVRVRRLREYEGYLMGLLPLAIKGVVEDPPTCPVCECWGAPVWTDQPGCNMCGGEA